MNKDRMPTHRTRFKYIKLADDIQEKIQGGDYKAGEKLPSLRVLHRRLGLSISTVHQAYIELEKRGLIASNEKSGFYVKPASLNTLPTPSIGSPWLKPKRVHICELTDSIVEAMGDPAVLNLGGAAPDSAILPIKALTRHIKNMSARALGRYVANYERPSGHIELKREIARRTLGLVDGVTSAEVIPTNGCLEAVGLCLRAVARPGDTIVIESPAFHGFLQLIEDLNMYALEVPAHPDTGVDIKMLVKAVQENEVGACLLTPNFQNPLGALMPDEKKADIVAFMNRKEIPIIEDDIFGELAFGKTRPLSLIAFDKKGLVLYCASFSKVLAPGLRVGWILPGRFKDQVKRLKLNLNLATAGLNQAAIAEFIKSGAFDRHLRRLRNTLKNQMGNTARVIAESFPAGTKITAPKGGLLLWVELDRRVDSLALYHKAREKNISILPGTICATSKKYSHFIRINCGLPWSERVEKGIARIGEMVGKMI